MVIRIIITENGKAATIIAFCKAINPPEYNNTSAIDVSKIPHISLIRFAGLATPLVDIIARTNVPESADVIKNTATKIMAIMDITIPNGK